MSITLTRAGLPPKPAGAVVLVITAIGGTSVSSLTVYSPETGRPITSNLHWGVGDTVSNLVTSQVSSNGQVNIFNAYGSVDVVADLEGYYAPPTGSSGAGHYVPVQPFRLLDTRESYPIGPGASAPVKIAGTAVPPEAEAVAIHLTARNATAQSYLTVVPGSLACSVVPCVATWSMAWTSGTTVSNLVIASLGPGPDGTPGWISFFNRAGSVDLAVDVEGWYAGTNLPASVGLTFTPLDPCRASHGEYINGPNPIKLAPHSCGIPLGALAVVGNISVTAPTHAGSLNIWSAPPVWTQRLEPACRDSLSTGQETSELAWSVPGKTVANLVQVGLASDGVVQAGVRVRPEVTGFNADFDIDLDGYFSPGLEAPHQLCIGVRAPAADPSQPDILPPSGVVTVAVFDQASGDQVTDERLTFSISPTPGSPQCSAASLSDGDAANAGSATTRYRLAGPGICLISARDGSAMGVTSSVIFGLLTLTSTRSGSTAVVTATYRRADGSPHPGARLEFEANRMDSLSDGILVSSNCLTDQAGRCRFSYSYPGIASVHVTDPVGLLQGMFVPGLS